LFYSIQSLILILSFCASIWFFVPIVDNQIAVSGTPNKEYLSPNPHPDTTRLLSSSQCHQLRHSDSMAGKKSGGKRGKRSNNPRNIALTPTNDGINTQAKTVSAGAVLYDRKEA
jgi:hypothetical protein